MVMTRTGVTRGGLFPHIHTYTLSTPSLTHLLIIRALRHIIVAHCVARGSAASSSPVVEIIACLALRLRLGHQVVQVILMGGGAGSGRVGEGEVMRQRGRGCGRHRSGYAKGGDRLQSQPGHVGNRGAPPTGVHCTIMRAHTRKGRTCAALLPRPGSEQPFLSRPSRVIKVLLR